MFIYIQYVTKPKYVRWPFYTGSNVQIKIHVRQLQKHLTPIGIPLIGAPLIPINQFKPVKHVNPGGNTF